MYKNINEHKKYFMIIKSRIENVILQYMIMKHFYT